jgi:hypothetical protein
MNGPCSSSSGRIERNAPFISNRWAAGDKGQQPDHQEYEEQDLSDASSRFSPGEQKMLHWSVTFLIMALIEGAARLHWARRME